MTDPGYKDLLEKEAEVKQLVDLALQAQDYESLRSARQELTTIIAGKAIIEAIYKTRY